MSLSGCMSYPDYCHVGGPDDVGDSLLEIVETYWKDYVEQPLCILALWLHPKTRAYAKQLRSDTDLTKPQALDEFIKAYFQRWFPDEDSGKLRQQFVHWRNGTLGKYQQFVIDVSLITCICNIKYVGKDIDPDEFDTWLDYWSYIAETKIAIQLSKVAIKVLSAIVQSATCERLFSQFLLFHTKIRNRLGAKKVMYSTLGKRVVHRKDLKEEIEELKARGLPLDVHKRQCVRLVDHRERPKKAVVPTVSSIELLPEEEVVQAPV